jgi:hypothetical protein
MHVPINAKPSNNTSKIQMGFNSAFKWLTAVGYPSGGSSTVHIYTQTIQRKTQNKKYCTVVVLYCFVMCVCVFVCVGFIMCVFVRVL